MDNQFLKSLCFVWLYCLLISTDVIIIGSHAVNCSSAEREALISFKHGLSDPSARLSSWVGQNCCDWSGITCHVTSGKVAKIDLHNSLGSTIISQTNGYFVDGGVKYKKSCLRGEISASLVELKYLNYLDLSWNDFEGAPIPYFLGMLKSLRYLNLFCANFGGGIPNHLGNLSNLNYLDLSIHNLLVYAGGGYVENLYAANLYAANLQWLSGLSSLKYLNLGGVNLSRVQPNWMHAVNELSSLSELHLSNCDISSFDSSVALLNLTSLKVIDFSDNRINSSIPAWLSNLTSLSTLDLRENLFHGTISEDFEKSRNLQYLDLSWNTLWNINTDDCRPSFSQNLCKLRFLSIAFNNFEGKLEEFLDSFSNCTRNSLESLNLQSNRFVGEIPNSLETFKNLRSLNLYGNALWGSLPNSIGNLSSLQHLRISNNFLNGTIPSSFGQLSKLIEFRISFSSWNTTITEAHLVNLTKLKIFVVTTETKHDLVFNMSYDWISPFRLNILYLKNCLIAHQFPVWLRIQTQLTEITLSNVGISGSIPNGWISNKSSRITTLDLSNNLIKGELSHMLTSQKGQSLFNDSIHFKLYPNLRYLDLRNNLFSGRIPSNIYDLMPNLYELYLSKNCLNGTIPSSIKTMNYLRVLSMSDNQLSGELFDDWSRLDLLWVIDLSNNNLYGKISTTIGLLTRLNILMLSNNNLHGEIPKSLQNCSLLTSIDLAENRLLYGNLPSWIGGAVSQLQLLNLRSNRFNGTIPRQWCNLSSLRILDLSNNRLFGEIPSCLYNWTRLVHKDYDENLRLGAYQANGFMYVNDYQENTRLIMKGAELEYNTILNFVLTLDLSRNKLSGQIPNEIANLVQLGTLNLSNNEFVGTVPENIGAMQLLETLDLSCNHLSGRIPASLTTMNFLTHLNFSFNNLTGRIPTSNHLQTLEEPSIYEGNPSLCGTPLITKCPGDDNSSNDHISTNEEEENDKENDSVMFSICIGMTIGFPVGLNILFLTIFTNEARRIIYFRFIDRVNYNILETIDFLTIGMRRMIWRRS